jgi:hypothetical protein
MNRHIRQYCKIANSDEGMETLMEHTLQKQMATVLAENASMKAQVERLAEMLEKQLALVPQAAAPSNTAIIGATTVNTGPVTNNTHITNKISIRSWSGDERIVVTTAMVKAAFTENPRLIEYCRFSDNDKTNAESAAPYVMEALMDLVRRAHADPAARNVYLSPKRADQVMVFDESTWRVITLIETIQTLFNEVANTIHHMMITDRERAELPFSVQASASWIPHMYRDEPDNYVKMAKGPMAAHLTNMAPQLQ